MLTPRLHLVGAAALAQGVGSYRVRCIGDPPTVEHGALGLSRHTRASHRVDTPAALSPPMHTPHVLLPRLTPKLLHWQDPDTVARVLKGRRDVRCATPLHTSIGPRCPIASLHNTPAYVSIDEQYSFMAGSQGRRYGCTSHTGGRRAAHLWQPNTDGQRHPVGPSHRSEHH